MYHEVALQKLQGKATNTENTSQKSLMLKAVIQMDKGKLKVFTEILTILRYVGSGESYIINHTVKMNVRSVGTDDGEINLTCIIEKK